MNIRAFTLAFVGASALLLGGCNDDDSGDPTGPDNPGNPPSQPTGNATSGRDVFLFETFGNERFWTDAMKIPAGMVAAGVTPVQALRLGLIVDVDRLSSSVRSTIAAELAADPSGATSTTLNSPATTLALLNANAVVGLVVKDTNGDGMLNVAAGDKVGATCALCHTITDGSVLKVANGGSIGKRIDGPANHNLDFGALAAIGQNSRAFYPFLQLSLAAKDGATLGRAAAGLTETSTEAAVDAYLNNKQAYPVGMFDDSFDGNGDPMHNMPLFEQDLAGPYGSEGSFDQQSDFANLVYTGLLDPTGLTTAGGRAFLNKLGGAAGDEIATEYVGILTATGVTGYPFVQATAPANAADAGGLAFPLGVRVDSQKLADLNAFLFALPAPAGSNEEASAVSRGRTAFEQGTCVNCHNSSQTRPVPTFIVPMLQIFPGDAPVTLAQRTPPLNPVMNTVASTFDDKMAVVNASIRGLERGTALPLLLDLARKPVFLHDNSVASLDQLLDPARGPTAPHAQYITDPTTRADVIAFLRSR